MTINLSREERAASSNRGTTRLPAVSPGFINEADAAYWAHKKIGARRDKEYGGVILRKYTGRYHATEPVPGKGLQFDLREVLTVSADGQFEQPKGYTCVASYHSHPADHELTQKANPNFDSKTVKAFLSFFSDGDFWHGVNNRDFFPAAYLSGPDGSLIRYASSGSVEERSFALWIKAGRPRNNKVALFGPFSTFVKKLSTLGTLSLIVPTALWGGSAGDVPADWVVFQPFSSGAPTPQPLFTGVFTEVQAAINVCEPVAAPARQIGIVIKAQGEGRAEYAVSQPEPAQVLGWLAGDALPVLPAGWELHGMYVDSSPVPEPFPPMQAWLYQCFISPLDLATHIAGYRRLSKTLSVAAAGSLYIRTSDAAVLRYGFSGSDAESQLFAQAADGSVTDNGIQSLLQAGTLLPQGLVKQVAEAGQLSVERTSDIWDKKGAVDKMWRPFSKIPEPQLSPAFITADDAARWAHEVIGTRRDLEYGGVILKRGYRYYATHPIPDRRAVFEHGLLLARDSDGNFIAPDDYSAEAFYHSHPVTNIAQARINYPDDSDDQLLLRGNFYSRPDLRFSIRNRAFARAHYLSGPDDALIKYVSSGSALESAYYQELHGVEDKTSSDFESKVVWKLAEAGELSVVIPNPVWGGVRGLISKGWRIRTPATAQQQQPFFTEAYSRPEHAVMRALVLAGPENIGTKFGVVLKHRQENIYAATLALPRSVPLFSPSVLFPKRQDGGVRLPSQYRLEAIYFSSWYETNEIAARETWLASAFFTPSQVVAAARQARATLAIQHRTRGLTLYMQASDSALLALKVPEATATSELVQESSTGELHDNGAQAGLLDGTLSPRTYVRRVISATALSVVEAGGLWRYVGPVDNRLLVSFYTATLSRSFLSARDAAVYAHEQVGSRRDRYYGGYVLKGEDGRFVITEPIESRENPFLYTLFFPSSNHGPLIPPEPYVLHGRYGSHLELSMADPVPILRRGWTRDEALINQQVFSCNEMYAIIPAGRVAYLSAAPNCLLEYTPNKSSAETTLLANLSPQAGDNSFQARLDRGDIKPADWVWRVAETGDLKIIQGNRLWGPRSVVYRDWSANYNYAPRSGPLDYVTYGAVFTSADDAASDLHGRVHGRHFPEEACYAFILKHKDKDQYIASEVVGATRTDELFNRYLVFKRITQDQYQLPDGFELHGLFRSQQWLRKRLRPSNEWLARFFVQPDVLYAAIYEARGGSADSLPIYFSTHDGALLRYRPSPIDVTSGGTADTLLGDAQRALDSGIKRPVEFVREWSLRGQLQVVRISQLWDKAGLVSNTWTSYATLMPRHLSPAFASPDDAARHIATLTGNGHRRTYGGVILKLVSGLYAATEPLAIPPQGLALNWIYPDHAVSTGLYPGGSTIVARYRTLLDQEVPLLLSSTQKAIYKSMIPSRVLASLLNRDADIMGEYVFGANGSILSYQLSNSIAENSLKNRLEVQSLAKDDYVGNLIEQQIRSGVLTPLEFVTLVAKAGKLSVVKNDRLWGQARQITGEFATSNATPNPGDIRQVLFDSACGPIFTRAFDAVRYAQRMAKSQTDVSFGYVLKTVKKSLYMTTLPLVREKFDDFRRVFINGQLPQGYVLEGMYLCASTVAIAPAGDEMAHSFFPPQDIGKALNFLIYASNGKALPLYLMCGDGALLKYLVQKTAQLYDWTKNAVLERSQLLNGTLKVREYVRRLAAMGELEIRVTSVVWGRKERVMAQWTPKKAPHAFADDPHFHSFCGPLFLYPDDAARYAQGLVAPFQDKQYLGAVLMPDQIQGYVAIDPVEDRGTGGTSTRELLFWIDHAGFDVPAGNVLSTYKIAAVHAFYKAIPSTVSREPREQKLLTHFVSKDDLRGYLAVIRSNAPYAKSCYLSSRGGALLKYVPAFTQAETTLLSPGDAPDPSVLVSQLRAQGSLSVLVADAFWMRVGVLGAEWNGGEALSEPQVGKFWYEGERDEL
ncbi:DUF4329 domain-containing protein [Pseudomonas sp. 58 R 3]|uniref:DUF4329 domain-containing protein n=1 Tax=Pseudomonas sp. 58 R 3 TaxID=1844108 RepID=UPI0008124042|nr:DUF4329 domain-containing protein [Pseudomonas sp. 58 R 3]CRM62232.1 hypothetical protein [Pseudomonas sp. 58 R 3]